MQAPHIELSADGTSAWMAVQMEARLTATNDNGDEQLVAFESSWISVYEKREGRW